MHIEKIKINITKGHESQVTFSLLFEIFNQIYQVKEILKDVVNIYGADEERRVTAEKINDFKKLSKGKSIEEMLLLLGSEIKTISVFCLGRLYEDQGNPDSDLSKKYSEIADKQKLQLLADIISVFDQPEGTIMKPEGTIGKNNA